MSRYLFLASLALTLLIFPPAYGHGGGHGGGGHGGFGHGGFGYGGHHGFGYGGYHGFGYGGYGFHGFGYGYGFRGFGYGGFGYPGFGFGGLYGFGGYGLYGFGGLGYGGGGYGGLGYGGLGYGGLGLGGLGYGGLGFRGFGYGGYGGFSGACNCGYLSGYPIYGGGVYSPYGGGVPAPVYGGVPVNSGGDPLPMPRGVSSRPRYVDYYARNMNSATPSATASAVSQSRYVDYYARNVVPSAQSKALVHVSLPADAELWLNGKRMTRTGSERDFISPQLQEGESYAYEIKARWTQDGRPQEETIEVKVRANKTTNVRLGEASLAKR